LDLLLLGNDKRLDVRVDWCSNASYAATATSTIGWAAIHLDHLA
jgi:hypothetical protein